MSELYSPPLFPAPPFTASVYFNYADFIDTSKTSGHLHQAPDLKETMNVLAGNGAASTLFPKSVVDFFAAMNAITAVASDTPIDDFLCLFAPKKGKALYAPKGGIFLEAKRDLRFAVEDTAEGALASRKAGRRVIGVFKDYADPDAPKGKLRGALRDQSRFITARISDVPAIVMERIIHHYDNPLFGPNKRQPVFLPPVLNP